MRGAITRIAVIALLRCRLPVSEILHDAIRTIESRCAVACTGLQIQSNQLPDAFEVKKEIPNEKQN
jgi:hypothetical protein